MDIINLFCETKDPLLGNDFGLTFPPESFKAQRSDVTGVDRCFSFKTFGIIPPLLFGVDLSDYAIDIGLVFGEMCLEPDKGFECLLTVWQFDTDLRESSCELFYQCL